MNRRGFLQLVGAAALAPLLPALPAPAPSPGDRVTGGLDLASGPDVSAWVVFVDGRRFPVSPGGELEGLDGVRLLSVHQAWGQASTARFDGPAGCEGLRVGQAVRIEHAGHALLDARVEHESRWLRFCEDRMEWEAREDGLRVPDWRPGLTVVVDETHRLPATEAVLREWAEAMARWDRTVVVLG